MSTAGESDQGFFTFYREYTHTGIHAASTAGLTAFGLLTFVHRAFVVLAIAIYVLPPIYLYLTREDDVDTVAPSDSSDAGETDAPADASDPVGSSEPSESGDSTGSAESPRSDEPAGTAESGGRTEASRSAATTTAAADSRPGGGRPRGDRDGGEGTTGRVADLDGERSSKGASERTKESTPGETTETTDVDAETVTEDEPSATATPAGVDTGSEDGGSGAEEPEVEPSEGPETPEEPTTREWTEADSPTDETLSDVVATGSIAYAVGTNGVLLVRDGGWETVLEHGPAAESNTLVGVDVTDDGGATWFTGDSGALGRYDAESGRHTDHSAPNDLTDNWMDVAVAGPVGEEGVYLVNGSGQVLAGEFDGSEVEWGEAIKPGSGSSMSAIEFIEEGVGYCCDTNSGVYETTDGEGFERIGVEDGGSFTAITAADPEAIAVTAADGSVNRYDGSVWTRLHAADVALDALDTDGADWFAAGDDGTIRELADGSWEPRETPVGTALHGVAVGEPSVAVGAEGTILELRPVEEDD